MAESNTGRSKYIYILEFFAVCWGMCAYLNNGTRSIMPVAIAVGWALAKIYTIKYIFNKSEKIAIYILTALFSFAVSLVALEELRDRLDGIECLINGIFLVASIFLLFFVGVRFVWNFLRKDEWLISEPVSLNGKITYWKYFGIIFTCLFLGLIIDLPGDLSKDSIGIVLQASLDEPMTYGFSFPIIWTMRACLYLTDIFGLSVSVGVSLYCTVQIALISLIEAEIVYTFAKLRVNKYIIWFSLFFFGLMPYNVQYCHTVWKDIPFSVCLVWLMFLLWKQDFTKSFICKKENLIQLVEIVLAVVGMCIFRPNGLYAYIISLPFLIISFWKKRKDMVVLLVVSFILALIIQRPVTDYIVNSNNLRVIEKMNANAETVSGNDEISDNSESDDNPAIKTDYDGLMSNYGSSGIRIVTIQQIAAVAMNRIDLTAEDNELIAKVLNVNLLEDKYDPYISDNTLKAQKAIDTKTYLQIWLKLGIKYPSTYISAWKNMTYGYWYPDFNDRTICMDDLAKNTYGIEKVEFMPKQIYRFREKIERSYTVIPIYGLFWSIGVVVWITAFAMALTIVKKGWRSSVCYILNWGLWISLLVATPVNGEFRYIYSFFLALPLTIALPYIKDDNK